jgi:uncharacterized membrane protein
LIVLQVAITILGPVLVLFKAKSKLISFLSPVVACYTLGIILGNLPGNLVDKNTANTMAEASVPLAIPLLLFSTNFMRWIRLAKSTVISFALIVISVLISSFSVSMYFKQHLDNFWQIAGMLVGVYTGGTPNMTAIGMSLGVDKEVFVLMNGADIILGAFYLLFVLTIGFRIMGKFLPEFQKTGTVNHEEIIPTWAPLGYAQRSVNAALTLLLSAICVGIAVGVSQLLFQKDVVALIMLIITTLGIAFSFSEKVRSCRGSYDIGQYLLLVFCVAIGSMANLEEIMNGSLLYVSYCGSVMLLAIVLHLVLCRIFKIDRDTAVITSVAGIFGPPFVGPIATALKNPEVLVSGLTSGLIGYAIGNYLGIGLAYFMQTF